MLSDASLLTFHLQTVVLYQLGSKNIFVEEESRLGVVD
jgi:hypothetical protein